jgi:hypothetical protein
MIPGAVLLPLLLGGCGLVASPSTTPALLTQPSPAPPTALPSPTGTPVEPPEPGTYEYLRKIQGAGGFSDDTPSMEFLPAVEVSPGVYRQQIWSTSRQGRSFSENLWRPDGEFSVASTFTYDTVCYRAPLMLSRPFPMSVGSTWESESVCSNDPETRRRIRWENEVTGTDSLEVDGRVIETFVVVYRVELTFRGGERTLYNEGTYWWSPEYRLSVKSELEVGYLDTADSATFSEEIRNLDPK